MKNGSLTLFICVLISITFNSFCFKIDIKGSIKKDIDIITPSKIDSEIDVSKTSNKKNNTIKEKVYSSSGTKNKHEITVNKKQINTINKVQSKSNINNIIDSNSNNNTKRRVKTSSCNIDNCSECSSLSIYNRRHQTKIDINNINKTIPKPNSRIEEFLKGKLKQRLNKTMMIKNNKDDTSNNLSIITNAYANFNNTINSISDKEIKDNIEYKVNSKNDDNKNYICSQCNYGFILYNNKCIDFIKLKSFIDVLKRGLTNDKHKLLDTISNRLLNPEDSTLPTLTNFNSFRQMINDIKLNSSRECQKKINSFMVTFEENLRALINLSNLIEEKNEIRIRVLGNKIISKIEELELKNAKNLLTSFKNPNTNSNSNEGNIHKGYRKASGDKEKYDSKNNDYNSISNRKDYNNDDNNYSVENSNTEYINKDEVEVLEKMFIELQEIIESSFNDIDSKISKYEEISIKKILNIQNSFSSKLGFLK